MAVHVSHWRRPSTALVVADGTAGRGAVLHADARKMQREIAKDDRPFAAPWAALIEGALAHASGDRTGAKSALERAVSGFDRADMALYREATRWRLAELSHAPTRAPESWLSDHGVPNVRASFRSISTGRSGGERGIGVVGLAVEAAERHPTADHREAATRAHIVADDRETVGGIFFPPSVSGWSRKLSAGASEMTMTSWARISSKVKGKRSEMS